MAYRTMSPSSTLQISGLLRPSKSANFLGVSQFRSSDIFAVTTAEPPAVAIEGVSHCYGTRQALNDVTFSIAPSIFAVLLGLNGAGKSTLFSLIMRLYAIQRGHIQIFGRDVRHASSEALRMVGEDGVSVLSATNLIDKVSDHDDVIVLHQGRVLGHGSVSRIVEAADAQDIRTAFTRLTQGADAATEAP